MTLCELAQPGGAIPNAMRYSMCIGGEGLHHPTPDMTTAAYSLLPTFDRAYIVTETLRYNDGREVVSKTDERRLTAGRAASVTHLRGHAHGRVGFWMDHDPRIVAVSYTYALA